MGGWVCTDCVDNKTVECLTERRHCLSTLCDWNTTLVIVLALMLLV